MAASTASFFEVGSRAYAQAQYEQALDHFSQAIKSTTVGHADRLKFVDHRIGTLLKLKRLDEALKDAKSMIREARTDGRGYLRCGQLESLKGDSNAAAKWYEHGVKNVSSSDRLHATLSAKLAKTQKLIREGVIITNPRDPLTVLPLEIVEMIIQLMDYRRLVICLRVSKAWKTLLTRLPPLCDTIDFSSTSRRINYQQFRAVLRRLTQYPRRAAIRSLMDPAAKFLPDHLERWFLKDCLEHLEIDDLCYVPELRASTSPKLKYLKFGQAAEISIHHVGAILQHFTMLEHARFEKVHGRDCATSDPHLEFPAAFDQPRLKHLELRCCGQRKVGMFYTSLTPFRCLDTLSCSGFTVRPDDGEFDLSLLPLQGVEFSNSNIQLPKMPSTVSELNLSGSTVSNLACTTVDLPQLLHLNLYGMRCGFERIYDTIILSAWATQTLQTLYLDLDNGSMGGGLGYLNHARLKHLRLSSQTLKDVDADEFASKVPNLESLRLENARITGVFIATLLRRTDCKLQYLFLQDCPDVSRDVIDFARNLGVVIEIKNKQDLHGGRRLVKPL